MIRRSLSFAALALLASACPHKTTPAGPDAGINLPSCSSAALADSASSASPPSCLLPLDTEEQGMLTQLDQTDWWVLQIDTLPPRALVTLTAQYKASSSPVIVSVELRAADGTTSLANASDPRHASDTSAGGPSPAQAVARLTAPGKYYVLVRDDTTDEDPAFDRKNPYYLKASLTSDPDLNEPNDTAAQATPISLTGCNTPAQIQGALSTAGDLDYYTFTVAPCAGSARTILYVEITAAPSTTLKLRPQYTLTDSKGTLVATNYSDSPMGDPTTGQQRVATAQLATAGKYTLLVNAYQSQHDTSVPPGDPTFVYVVKAALYSDLDQNEGSGGNDTTDTATAVPVSVGTSAKMTGRISYVGDKDTYAVTAPSGGARVHYQLSYRTDPGQFTAIPTTSMHQLSVFDKIDSTTCTSSCPGDPSMSAGPCVQGECLRQQRVEDSLNIPDMRNFEGEGLVPDGKTWYIQVSYMGGDGADDLTYDLNVEMRSASDEHPQDNPLVVNAGTDVNTSVGWGFGVLGPGADSDLPKLARGVLDYDAEIDQIWVQYNYTGGGAQALQVAWTIAPNPRSYDIGLHFVFCTDSTCSKKVEVPGGDMELYAYDSGTYNPWYYSDSDGGGYAGLQKAFAPFDKNAGLFKVSDVMCLCIDPAYANGTFLVAAEAIDRTSYTDTPVTLSIGVSQYPQTAVDDSGKTITCPVPCGWVAWYGKGQ